MTLLRDTLKQTPKAGEEFRVRFPFIRDEYAAFDEEGPVNVKTWRPGVGFEAVGPYGEESEAYANGEGWMILSVVGVYKPGRFPTRVFYTRKFISPSGDEFGKGKLQICTLEKFRRISASYQYPYVLDGDEA